jgi:hypothetical protein
MEDNGNHFLIGGQFVLNYCYCCGKLNIPPYNYHGYCCHCSWDFYNELAYA